MLLEHTYETLKQESDLVQLILREKPYLPYMPDGEEHDENNNNDGLTTILSLCSLAKDWHTTEVCLRRMVQSSEDNKFVANRKLDDMRIWDALVEATIGLNNDEYAYFPLITRQKVTDSGQGSKGYRRQNRGFPRAEASI